MTMSGNDFRMYAGVDFSSEFLAHYGVGHLQGGNSGRYKWGSGKNPKQSSGKRVFVSGSSKTQDKESGYYRQKLPKAVRQELDTKMKNGNTILVGDAPGIDRQVQDYLKEKKYKNVEVYGPGSEDVRYQADKEWKKNLVDDPDHEKGSSEWLAAKDKAMSDAADEGIAVILDEGAKATRNNIARLMDDDKQVSVYELNKAHKMFDKWINDNGKQNIYITCKLAAIDEEYSKKADAIGAKVDARISQLLNKNPELGMLREGRDGYEYVHELVAATKDRKLKELVDKADEESFELDREWHMARVEAQKDRK